MNHAGSTTIESDTATLLSEIAIWRTACDGGLLECWSPGAHHEPISIDSPGAAAAAWRERAPTLYEGHHDQRTTVALPAVRGDQCRGVIELTLEADPAKQGAVELWQPNDRGELARTSAWYSGLERFAAISQCVKFPRRAGLPGKVWADRFPRVMGALGSSADFVRAAGAKSEGLATAVGIPFMKNALDLHGVLLLISSAAAPLARVMEVWSRDPATQELKIVSADYGPYVDLGPVSRKRRLHLGEGIAGHVYRDQAPWMSSDLVGVEFPRGEKFVEYGFSYGVGFPVFVATSWSPR